MARAERAAATGKRLYERFLAPLVLGGDVTPGPAVGARAAFDLDGALAAVDTDLRSQVDLARVRVARRLVAVDMLDGPSTSEWALAAALHDMVHALHPELDGVLHRSAPDRLLALAEQTIGRVAPATSLADAVSRHAFFARAFELRRTDTVVSWWTGSRTFLGTAPPSRLLAWPEVRRVHTDATTVPLAELPSASHAGRAEHFRRVVARWLEKVPLTDLATCSRELAPFAWTGATLGLFATPRGRVLGLRALALGPAADVDAALGRATVAHVKASAWENLARIGDILAERALTAASTELGGPSTDREVEGDAHYARVLGASLALGRIDTLGLTPQAARAITSKLMPLTQSLRGRDLAEVVRRLAVSEPGALRTEV